MKYILYIFAYLGFSLYSNYSSGSVPDTKVLDGLNDVYNLKFDGAENKFRQLQKSDPNDIKGYFYESLLYFYRALPSRDEIFFEKYLKLSDNVIEKAEKNLDKNENDFDALYYKGLSHSYRSLLMLSLNKSLLQAASNGNEGYRILTSLIEKKPDYYDAYMGLGLYKIAIGFVPEKFQWLLSLIGFNGNIKEGVKLLRTSMQYGDYTKTDSKVFLSIFSLKEREDSDILALDLSKELTQEYPGSAVFKIFYSSLLIQYGFTDEAIATANEALDENNNSFQVDIKKAANAVLGTAYFRLNNFPKTVLYLEEFMKYVNNEDRYNLYLFTLGISYEINGDRVKALEKYKSARNDFINERDGELDKFFYRLAQEKIKTPVSEFEINLVKGINLRESNKIEDAIKTYVRVQDTQISGNSFSDDKLIQLYFNLGMAFTYNKDFIKAEECFKKCISLNPKSETWLLPHSYFELGKIYNIRGDKKQSEEMFENIFNYDDFDFESFLEMRLVNYKNK
ncbi:MAG: DUF3808 domain-containing protein [Bacteroidota bacterium]|nr:DUF3808 domain-containing protein [Bacteroidota bacterium]